MSNLEKSQKNNQGGLMINKNYFLEAAEYAGHTWEFAESKLDAYLETRGDDAEIALFVKWLETQKGE